MCKEYNGYTNYPTWNVMLWIDNDEGLYDEARSIARQDYQYKFEAETAIKDWIESLIYELGASTIHQSSMEADILGWALSSVNWREIVDLLKEED